MGKKIKKAHIKREKFSKLTRADLDRMAHSLVTRGLASRLILDGVFRTREQEQPPTQQRTGNR